jgi:hypothetical protein
MFQSKQRAIVVPQWEHARLAGAIAYHWGNDHMAPPPLDRDAFALGVTFHDRGYGRMDNMPIGGVDESIWLATQQRGINMRSDDVIVDTVALMHIRRLLSYNSGADVEAVTQSAETRIAQNIAQTAYTRQDFENADSITRTCDMISFRFCFEDNITYEEKAVFNGDENVTIQVDVRDGHINLHPWTLSVPELRGFILGYEQVGYPDHLRPVILPYTVTPKE